MTALTPVPQTGEHGHRNKLIDELAKGKAEKILRGGLS
jgi:hypothetical protein